MSNDAWWILIFNIVIPPVSKYFDVFYIYRLYKRKKIEEQDQNCPLNQRQANAWFEGSPFNFASSYANHLVTIMSCMFFLPMLPLAPVLGALAIITAKYTEKYLMLRRNTAPRATGIKFCITMYRFYDFVILAYAVSF